MEFSLATNASTPVPRPPGRGDCVGKSVDSVQPATYAFPAGSTAMAVAASHRLPPR